MIVSKITESKYKDKDGNPTSSWWTEFEGEKLRLFTRAEPHFKVGDDIPATKLEEKKNKKGDPYLVFAEDKPTPKLDGVTSHNDKEVWTAKNCAMIQATELVRTFVDPKLGLVEATKCTQETAVKLFAILMTMHGTVEKK